MGENRFKAILDQQKSFFSSGKSLPIDFRIEQLKKLKSILQTQESKIAGALKKDLNKAETPAVLYEILLVIKEIDFMVKNLHEWARPVKVKTPLSLLPARSEIYFEPYGIVLIIGPWNFPFNLVMAPLIGAMSAGNCVVIKPSEVSGHTQDLILDLINNNFPAEYVTAVSADPEQMNDLLQEKFDYIFFTGGTAIGKIIMQAAAKHLTPVTLELGGKCPAIVDESANIDYAARRIIWGKTMNAGQMCVSPDYLLVHRSQKETMITKLQNAIKQFYGDDPAKSSSFGRIINKKHFERLTKLMEKCNILYGGTVNKDDLYISPTLIDGVSWNDPIMQEEIFGPLLPILTYDKMEDMIALLAKRPKSLALYLFTKNKENEKTLLNNLSFGGGCVNDCLWQTGNYNLPFGGVGESGMGHYHGKYSFETFSHHKSIYKKLVSIDPKIDYPPYTKFKLWLLRKLVNF